MLAITLFATLMTMVTSIEAAPLEAKHATRDLVSRATPSVPSSGTSIGQGYVVQGCYSDSWWSSAFDYTSSSSSMTQESCAAQCYAAKKPYMAVENGSDCYCGYDFNWFSGSSQVANSNCNYACSGNSKQNCGGYYNMVVFKYGGSFTATTSAAASSAKTSAAASSSASSAKSSAPVSSSSAVVSSSSAAKSSAAASSSSAAPSSSSAAVSSSSSPVAKSSAVASSTSSSAAAASSSAASLTGLTTTNGWTSQGCYQDAWPHFVPDYFERQSYMTQEYCGTQCFNMGKPYMAVEYGTDCYCASSLATGSAYPKLADNQCTYPCGGNSAENCGGNWILVLFKYTGTASFPSSSSASSAIASSSVASASASASVSSAAVSSSAAQSSAVASSSSAPASSAAASSAAVVSSAPASSAAASSSAPVSSAAASSAAPIVLPSAAASVVNSVVPSLAPSSTSSAAVVIPTVIAIDPLAVPTPWIAASVPVIAEATYDVKRALTGSSLSSDDMTYTKCLNFCSSGGFALAGLEYGRECYCGNYLTNGASLSLPATATMTCAGANSTSTALCGGPNAITLFYQPTKISGLASDFTTRTATLASGWSAASTPCLQEGSSQRVLSLDSYFSDNMTTSSCVAYCDSKGFGYAGIEYGRECYCGNSLNSNVISNSCNMACAGDSIQTCGGPNAISLFRNPSLPKINSVTLPSGWSAASSTCIQEVSGRALNGASTSGSDMTVPKCLNFCSSKGFQYGAVEYGSECYCGSSLVNGASLSLTSGQCNVACAGDSTNNCGGPNALQLYVNPSLSPVVNSVNGFANSGCIQEVAGRALTGASTTATNMTAAVCTSYCQSQGFTMAGVEYGQECYCGNSLVNGASTALTSGQCVMPCAGDATTICGGPNAINLYTVSSS